MTFHKQCQIIVKYANVLCYMVWNWLDGILLKVSKYAIVYHSILSNIYIPGECLNLFVLSGCYGIVFQAVHG